MLVGAVCSTALAWAALLGGETWHRCNAPGTAQAEEAIGRTWTILMAAGVAWVYLLLWQPPSEEQVKALQRMGTSQGA